MRDREQELERRLRIARRALDAAITDAVAMGRRLARVRARVSRLEAAQAKGPEGRSAAAQRALATRQQRQRQDLRAIRVRN